MPTLYSLDEREERETRLIKEKRGSGESLVSNRGQVFGDGDESLHTTTNANTSTSRIGQQSNSGEVDDFGSNESPTNASDFPPSRLEAIQKAINQLIEPRSDCSLPSEEGEASDSHHQSNLPSTSSNNADTCHQTSVALMSADHATSIKELCDTMGYNIYQENGQRKFCSPDYMKIQLEKGCEVFVGKIPRDCFEDELVPILGKAGKIFELRLMMDFSGTTRGFGFVSYYTPDEAQEAVNLLNNYEIRPGKNIGICLSIDNCRLFIGGIPKFKTKQEILEEMSKITDEVIDVIVYPSVNDKMKNRGFAFVEYKSHRAAAMARRRLIPGKICLWGNAVAVDWAEPELDVPKGVMNQVKILYVRNLMLSTTEEYLHEVFASAANCSIQQVERVRKLKDFAFIHFSKRELALKAIKALDGTNIDGAVVEVTLAKPVDKQSHYFNKIAKIAANGGSIGMKNLPTSGPTASRYNNLSTSNQNLHHFHAQVFNNAQPALDAMNQNYSMTRGFESPSQNSSFFSCVKLLQDICYANNWGSPIYDMTISTSQNAVLYSFQVTIPHLKQYFSPQLLESVGCDEQGTFVAKEFIPGLEEAKEICAGSIISSLDALSQRISLQSTEESREINGLNANPLCNLATQESTNSNRDSVTSIDFDDPNLPPASNQHLVIEKGSSEEEDKVCESASRIDTKRILESLPLSGSNLKSYDRKY